MLGSNKTTHKKTKPHAEFEREIINVQPQRFYEFYDTLIR